MRAGDGQPFNPIDFANYQINYYRHELLHIKQDPSEAEARLKGIARLVDDLKNAGWTVSAIRLPVGRRMQTVESDIPDAIAPERAFATIGIPFTDLNDRLDSYPTQDESHLSPEAAISIAPLLARLIGAKGEAASR